jgi:hypothetical protein
MPQPRKYQTRGEQQAAYRKRQAQSRQELLSGFGLPRLPAVPTIPGHARWRAMIGQAYTLLSEATGEMQTYHDDRSEAWQESDKAEQMLAKMEQIQEAAAQLQNIE